ncbi:MAG: tetratricopeptide repeat protein [Ignavibacterium sp.]|nr:MAG: tetratricopeptide repeat protein [Ignavibacterium sp.]
MTETENIEFNKKVSLIYEYNKNTPLFVKVAHSELEKNNIDEAVEILNTGLKIHKEHPTANLLLGKAYSLRGNYAEAIHLFKKGSKIIRSDETYDYYFKELEKIRKQRSLFETTKGSEFYKASDEIDGSIINNEIFEQETESTTGEDLAASIDERLEQLAEEISKAKLSPSYNGASSENEIFENLSGENLIVSETLAKIYYAQNEYEEAINVYKKLINKDASKYDYYIEKINEIRAKLSS